MVFSVYENVVVNFRTIGACLKWNCRARRNGRLRVICPCGRLSDKCLPQMKGSNEVVKYPSFSVTSWSVPSSFNSNSSSYRYLPSIWGTITLTVIIFGSKFLPCAIRTITEVGRIWIWVKSLIELLLFSDWLALTDTSENVQKWTRVFSTRRWVGKKKKIAWWRCVHFWTFSPVDKFRVLACIG